MGFAGLKAHLRFCKLQARLEAHMALGRMLGHAQRATEDLATHVALRSPRPCAGLEVQAQPFAFAHAVADVCWQGSLISVLLVSTWTTCGTAGLASLRPLEPQDVMTALTMKRSSRLLVSLGANRSKPQSLRSS